MSISMSPSKIGLEYVKTIGIVNNGLNGRGFANPYSILVGKDGRIFVLNRCDPNRAAAIRIGICNIDDEYLGEFGKGSGSGDGQFVWAVCMAMDRSERIYITDEYNHRVTIYDSSGQYISHWGTYGAAEGQINGPAGIAIDSQDNLFLVDQHNSRVQKFSLDGEFIDAWGSFGSGPGEFNLPWGLATDKVGNVYVADWRNDRIQKFSNHGEFVAQFGSSGSGEGQFQRPTGLVIDADGYIYVADWGNERVQVLDSDGKLQIVLKGEATVSKWGEEYFASNPEEKIGRDNSDLVPELPDHLKTAYHISSQTEPYFWGPVGVALDFQGNLYVVETNRHRFQVYRKI